MSDKPDNPAKEGPQQGARAMPRPASLESVRDYISTHVSGTFDEAFVTYLNGIMAVHNQIVSECPAGHQYASDYEMCCEYSDAQDLATAWLLDNLERGRRCHT